MAVEEHPLYPKWKAALERLIYAKKRMDMAPAADSAAMVVEYNAALHAYSRIAEEI